MRMLQPRPLPHHPLCSHWEGDTEDLSQRAPSYHMLITFLFN